MAWLDLKDIEAISATTSRIEAQTSKAQTSTAKATDPNAIQATAAQETPEDFADKAVTEVRQLKRFLIVVVSTIALEATGFYLSLISLPAGALVIISSQFWFNLLANVQLHPENAIQVVPYGVEERWVILAVNGITTGLLCLWPIQTIQLWLAAALLILVTLYLAAKYIFFRRYKVTT